MLTPAGDGRVRVRVALAERAAGEPGEQTRRARGARPARCAAFTVAPAVHAAPVGGFSRPSSSLTVGLTSPAPFRIGTTLQLKYGQDIAERAVRVRGADRAVEVVVGPSQVEQEPALAGAGVVGELVEEFVQHREAARQLRERRAQFLGGGPELVDDGQDLARERPDLVLDDRGGLDESRLRGFLAGAERLGERLQLLERRAEHARGRGELAQALLGLAERAGQQVQRALDVLFLFGEGLEHRVGGDDQLGQLLVLAAQRFDQQPEVVDRVRDARMAGIEL